MNQIEGLSRDELAWSFLHLSFMWAFLSHRRGILPRNWSLPDLSPARPEKEFHTCLPAGVMVLKGCGASDEVSQISRFITLLNSPLIPTMHWQPLAKHSTDPLLMTHKTHTQGWLGLAVACEPLSWMMTRGYRQTAGKISSRLRYTLH